MRTLLFFIIGSGWAAVAGYHIPVYSVEWWIVSIIYSGLLNLAYDQLFDIKK